MKTMLLPQTDLQVSQILYGCMQIGAEWDKSPLTEQDRRRAMTIIRTALDEGINFFDITIQAWSPLALGAVSGKPISDPDSVVARVAGLVKKMADEKKVAPEAILVAWLMRLPGQVQPVIGTTNIDRIHAACQGALLELSREEWYQLFTAGRGAPLP
jgi:predicted oxidoreductase